MQHPPFAAHAWKILFRLVYCAWEMVFGVEDIFIFVGLFFSALGMKPKSCICEAKLYHRAVTPTNTLFGHFNFLVCFSRTTSEKTLAKRVFPMIR